MRGQHLEARALEAHYGQVERAAAEIHRERGALLAALESMGGYHVDAITPAELSPCEYLIASQTPKQPAASYPGWELITRVERPTDRLDLTAIYRRAAATR